MLVPSKKTAVIVDQLAFRRARVESFLEPWAKAESIELISLQPEPANAKLIEGGCDILIYNVGAHAYARQLVAEIEVLRRLCPTAALVILASDTSPATIGAVMNSGAHGYLSDSMPPDLALHALSFILHGGTYFPPPAMLACQKLGETRVAESAQPRFEDLPRVRTIHTVPQQEPMAIPGYDDDTPQRQRPLLDETAPLDQQCKALAVTPCDSARIDRSALQLTDRQQSILRCICRGDSNKIIARTFDIAESTVKIHVKMILRKISVKNRTQAAIWAIQSGLCSPHEASETLSKARLI